MTNPKLTKYSILQKVTTIWLQLKQITITLALNYSRFQFRMSVNYGGYTITRPTVSSEGAQLAQLRVQRPLTTGSSRRVIDANQSSASHHS